MKNLIKFLMLATIVAIIFTACKKDDPEDVVTPTPTPTPDPTLTELVEANNWKIDSMILDTVLYGQRDAYVLMKTLFLDSCLHDDYFGFENDDFINFSGLDNCDSLPADTVIGSYIISDDSSTITINEWAFWNQATGSDALYLQDVSASSTVLRGTAYDVEFSAAPGQYRDIDFYFSKE